MPDHDPEDGRRRLEQPGFSYLPQFISKEESQQLIEYFGQLTPLWERRHPTGDHQRSGGHARRLTRPVYWLGAWQFAALGYYAEPLHREDRCLRGEPFPAVMHRILERLRGLLEASHAEGAPEGLDLVPNTCLINYYGREVGRGVPRDYARLRMHRDGEPGPVVMFNIGQPGLLEFLDPDRSPEPELRLWTRHRSITILSGPEYKDRLYHRVVQVRTGREPKMGIRLPNFELRRVSVSFRQVPDELIADFAQWPAEQQAKTREYVELLARHSDHYRAQLGTPTTPVPPGSRGAPVTPVEG
jgi:hypothetical protein